MKRKTLINISKRTFSSVCILFAGLLVFSIAMTYLLPKGSFGTLADGGVNYLDYRQSGDQRGIPIWKGILAPVLVFFSEDGLSLSMLSLFLFVISAAFQVMNDTGGIKSIVQSVSDRFQGRRSILLVLISLLFYCFGSFLGLFEEMLTMLPIVAALCISMGFDSFTGFLCCTISCGFGFASAITNPFTVLFASQIIGANPMAGIWLRLVFFAVMFVVLQIFIHTYTRMISSHPDRSLTFSHDQRIKEEGDPIGTDSTPKASRAKLVYSIFLLAALILIVGVSLLDATRGYAVVVLTAYFLVFGILAGVLACADLRLVLKSFGRGFLGALPTLAFIAFAASVKYVFEVGGIMPTLVHQINSVISGHSSITVALSIFLIVLVLEFFISSSSAKAILVMGILAMVNTGLSKQMLVLLYTCADGYTNVIFPTSPVLLISLSMIGIDYFRWARKGWILFVVVFILTIALIALGIFAGY